MAKKLFVGSLSWNTTDQTLNDFFSQVGPVLSAKVITDKFSGRSKGFGFVEMENDADADKAKAELSGKALDGREIAVHDAKPQEPRENRGGGGNYQRNDFRGGNDRNRNQRRY